MKKLILITALLASSSSWGACISGNCTNGIGTYTWGENTEWAGDKYVGEWKDNKRQGQGTYTHGKNSEYAGDKYVGEYQDGKRHGQGTYTWADGDKYVGEFQDGKRHGRGICIGAVGAVGSVDFTDGISEDCFYGNGRRLPFTRPVCPESYSSFTWHNCIGHRVWPNGKDYVGEFENGRSHGQGALIQTDGYKYVGQFKAGKAQGQGSHSLANGEYYDGEYQDDKRHGQGTYTHANGEKYIGEFKNDKYHGQGTLTFRSGSKYIGEWKDDKRHGQGTYTHGKNSEWAGDKYVGEYQDGKRHGQGTYTFANGDKYIGEWKDDEAHGQGTLTWADGNKYVGEYQDGKQHGQGTYTFANGDQYVGEWKDGKSHGIGNFYRADRSMMGGKWVSDEFIEGYTGYSCTGNSAVWSDCIGTLTLADGTQFIGEFLNGKPLGKGTFTFPDNRPMRFAVEPYDQAVSSPTNKARGTNVAAVPTIGDTVKTKYFDVIVNAIESSNYIGDEYFGSEAGPGNVFLVIDVTYKNTDTEARSLMSGEVMVRVGDEELRFDTAEIVFSDGFIVFDSLNPRVTRKGLVVFKIPEGLEGEIFYKPARSKKLIKLN